LLYTEEFTQFDEDRGYYGLSRDLYEEHPAWDDLDTEGLREAWDELTPDWLESGWDADGPNGLRKAWAEQGPVPYNPIRQIINFSSLPIAPPAAIRAFCWDTSRNRFSSEVESERDPDELPEDLSHGQAVYCRDCRALVAAIYRYWRESGIEAKMRKVEER
jgi:hypothetical protein